MSLRHIPLVCAVLISVSRILAAQQLGPDIVIGARVRVQVHEVFPQREAAFRRSQMLRGEVTRMTPDTLLLRPAPGLGELAVPLSQIQQLDRSLGVPSRGESALRNGIPAAVLGAVWFGLSYEKGEREYGVLNRGEATALGAGIGLAGGALWGAIAPTERWRRVTLPH